MLTDPKFDSSRITVVERILIEAWVGKVGLGDADTLVEDKYYRFAVTDSPVGIPARGIMKKARVEPGILLDPDATEANPSQPLLKE